MYSTTVTQYVDPTSLSYRVGLATDRDSKERGDERKGVTRSSCTEWQRTYCRHADQLHGVAANVLSSRGSVDREDSVRVDVTRVSRTE